MQLVELWSAGLTLLVGILGYIMHEKFSELARVTILLHTSRGNLQLNPSYQWCCDALPTYSYRRSSSASSSFCSTSVGSSGSGGSAGVVQP